jgi:hypothetical protein
MLNGQSYKGGSYEDVWFISNADFNGSMGLQPCTCD